MATITYQPMGHFITVRVDGKVTGGIYRVANGFAYKTASGHWGDTFNTIPLVKRDLEGTA